MLIVIADAELILFVRLGYGYTIIQGCTCAEEVLHIIWIGHPRSGGTVAVGIQRTVKLRDIKAHIESRSPTLIHAIVDTSTLSINITEATTCTLSEEILELWQVGG